MSEFKDNFSKQSAIYKKYRPLYPKALYAYLSEQSNGHKLAWDCGTGNGQAAVGLADFYEQVVATDPSPQQIQHGIPNGKVIYKVEKAEENSLADASVDIITIANALHWLNHETFYKEAKRVLKPNGLIAAWAYALPVINSEVDALVHKLHYQTLGDYWLPENQLVVEEYRNIPFPFECKETPAFAYSKTMPREDLLGYLNTWSATQRFITNNGYNPIKAFEMELFEVWAPEASLTVTWNLILKLGSYSTL